MIANYYGANGTLDFFGEIHWPLGKGPPKDTPECGYDGELCPPDGESEDLLKQIIIS